MNAARSIDAGALTAAGCGTAIAVVCTIGVYQIERLVGGLWSVAAIGTAAVACAVVARALARLSSVVPSGAGLLAYLSRALGRARGVAITVPYLILCVLLVGAEALIVGALVARVVPLPPLVGALAFVVGTWALCRAGVRVGYRAQAWATWSLVACLAGLSLAALVSASTHGALAARLLQPAPSWLHFASAVGQALFLFMGFELVTCHAEVAISPRAMGRALHATVLVLAAFYALVSLGYASSAHPVAQSPLLPQLVLVEAGSRVTLAVVVALSLVASFTSVNGALLALSRFVYALAAQKMLPAGLGRLAPRSLVAKNALAALLSLSLASTLLLAWTHLLQPALCASAVCASLVYAALLCARELPPFREAGRARWAVRASVAVALMFLLCGIAVLLDAGVGAWALLACAACVATLVARRQHG